ncbi:hypothetical protein BC938DRAFT_481829 [Jimgerdemannia flammicorona]|uniref:Uncharacterized protein n=1 Tax=Jimgerdemannia flammicorona TaxID=994334 RepID=A0A433QFE6_9FUNG|nr:hypothetical protein BC938DRAFT_481829 [Jimgerdemannia flammicorona]
MSMQKQQTFGITNDIDRNFTFPTQLPWRTSSHPRPEPGTAVKGSIALPKCVVLRCIGSETKCSSGVMHASGSLGRSRLLCLEFHLLAIRCREHNEMMLQKSLDEARSAMSAKSMFISNVSHGR